MPRDGVMLVVNQGYEFDRAHQRFYGSGTHQYLEDGGSFQTYAMSAHCLCSSPLYDGDPICSPRYERPGLSMEIVHVNCCTEHDHANDQETS